MRCFAVQGRRPLCPADTKVGNALDHSAEKTAAGCGQPALRNYFTAHNKKTVKQSVPPKNILDNIMKFS
jgi:hypothetical protein